jgi:glycosyltransferase involved in cell wall biosynthesis
MIKKICVITSAHTPFDVRIFHKEIKTLQSAGYKISIIAQYSKSGREEGMDIIAIPSATSRANRFFSIMPRMCVAAFRQKADAYHFHDPDLIVVGFLLKLFTRSKVIYDVHEDVPRQILSKYWIPVPARKPMAFIFNFIEKNIAKMFDAVVAATPSIANCFKGKALCVANYPLLSYFKPVMDADKKARSSVFTAIYAGALERIRGIEEIINALALIGPEYPIKLKLAGKFSESAFFQELAAMPGWVKVEFLGYMPLAKTYEELAQADVGMVTFLPEPNHIDAQPNKMFEYMAAGLPMIASDFPLWKKIIEGGKCGICVNPLNPEKIAGALEFLARSHGEAEKMGRRGRKLVQEVYNWESEGRKLLAMYKSL